MKSSAAYVACTRAKHSLWLSAHPDELPAGCEIFSAETAGGYQPTGENRPKTRKNETVAVDRQGS